uniref:flagellar basal body rod protein FlgB n=1 Tax=Pararhizobium sp. IMCC3301 TaxID=3067904 RepID=UPI0027410ECB|nr:flagellar basal body rod protein FlgB [Pararhizobium sp. IMCC3301]
MGNALWGPDVGIGDAGLLSALKSKMFWHESRQRLLAENVANADTPGFRARELAKPDFAQLARAASTRGLQLTPTAMTTNSAYISTALAPARRAEINGSEAGYEVTPQGNAVVLEEEMMKVTANQLDYQAATSLYSKTLGLFRIAIGR